MHIIEVRVDRYRLDLHGFPLLRKRDADEAYVHVSE